ncbi:hypothetical protein HBH43_212410 [Parastagonospora nodorum]|nr:hypothetical protein HBH43_212410 [Parastagonospora nodorum]
MKDTPCPSGATPELPERKLFNGPAPPTPNTRVICGYVEAHRSPGKRNRHNSPHRPRRPIPPDLPSFSFPSILCPSPRRRAQHQRFQPATCRPNRTVV